MTNAETETVDALLLTAAEAGRLCGIGVRTWWRLHTMGCVPMPVKLGRAVRWKRSELLAWIEAGCPPRTKWNVSGERP